MLEGQVGGVMSQTETLLLFVLGFFAALFLVLLLGRGVWSIVGNWNSWREQRRQPLVIRELQAERDSLKAEKAIMAQKLESSLSDMKMRMAEHMAEVARSRNRLLDMGATLKERENTISQQASLLADYKERVAGLETQIEENVKAINLAYAKVAQREEQQGKLEQMLKETQSALLLRDEKIRIHSNETSGLRNLTSIPDHHQIVPRTMDAQMLTAMPTTSGNPFEDVPKAAENDDNEVDRSVSNVLSLAERVRKLQIGVKNL